MKSTQRRKRRSRPSLARRVRTFWILIAVVVIGVSAGTWKLASAPQLHLHDLQITGLKRVSRTEVIAKAAIDPAANIWLLDKNSIAARIAQLPYVRSAALHRIPLGTVRIDVVERERDGCVVALDSESTIDDDRRVLETGCADDELPKYHLTRAVAQTPGAFIADSELVQLQSDAHALTATGRHFTDFALDAFGDLEATLPEGIRVRFGDDDDLPRKERLVGPILAQLGPRVDDVTSVDLRAPSAPVVQYRAAPVAPAPTVRHRK